MSTTLMDIYIKSECEGMDICVTCSSVCPELELLAEDTTTVLRQLLHGFDLDHCLKLLRPNKKLSLCDTCHETLKNASLFRNKALKSLRELEKEWRLNQLELNTQSMSAVEDTLTNETIDIKVEIDDYPATELDPLGALQSAVLSHKTTESNDLPSFDDANIKNEYDSDDYALSEFHSVSSENKIVPKEEMIETDLLDCEEKIGSSLLRKGSMNLGLGSKKLRVFSGNSQGSKEDSRNIVDLKLIVPIFETSHRTQASKSSQQLKSKPVKKVDVKEVEKNNSARDTDFVKKRINQVINMDSSTSTSHSNINSAPKKTFSTCFVPMCPSNSTKFPNKIFLNGPLHPEQRKIWFLAARRAHDDLAPKSGYQCCEDHFDLENDVENWMKYKLVGGRLFLKKNVVPHFFECQNGIKRPKHGRSIPKRKR